MDRSKFSVSAQASKTFTENAEKIQTNTKPMYIDWDKIKLPLYKEIVNKTDKDFEENIVQILPYILSSRNNLWVAKGLLPMGAAAYQNRAVRHNYVGNNTQNFLCMKKMYGLPCPLCEELSKMYKGKPNGWKRPREFSFLSAQVRDFYLVVPLVGEQAGQVCLYEVSNFSFTQPFEEARIDFIKSTQREIERMYKKQQAQLSKGEQISGKLISPDDFKEAAIDVTNPDNGYDVRFMIKATKKGEYIVNQYSGFKFLAREDAITDAVLGQTFDLSAMFKLTDYADAERAMQESINGVVDAENGVETTDDAAQQDEFVYPETDGLPFDDGTPTEPEAPTTPEAPAQQESAAPVEDGKTPCPHNIEKKMSAFECISCKVKSNCNRT